MSKLSVLYLPRMSSFRKGQLAQGTYFLQFYFPTMKILKTRVKVHTGAGMRVISTFIDCPRSKMPWFGLTT